jgi:hypothetical protein
VPVDFLSAAQIAAYGRYGEPPSVAQLERFFHFDERDRALIDRRRGDHNRLGFAVQLGTVRFLGTFLAQPAEVPELVARRVAEELSLGDPQPRYTTTSDLTCRRDSARVRLPRLLRADSAG